jgi:hypothetical protein
MAAYRRESDRRAEEGMPDTQEQRIDEATEAMESTAGEMQQRSDRVGEDIEETKATWSQAKASEQVPTAAGDWEDTDDDAGGDDPAGFDDPESLDLDDEDLEDDDGYSKDDE